jgi:hypothetical protein
MTARRGQFLLLFLLLPGAMAWPVQAHIGSPNVFFQGNAGAYPVRVTVRPPGVIPGLAEISVRVEGPEVQRVTVVPIRWNTGKQGAPTPDIAERVRGETNLFTAALWFMVAGAQSVEVEITGISGPGRVVVPVNAVATRVLTMPRNLGTILASLGAALVLLAGSIFGGAVRESVLPAGTVPSPARRWAARAMTLLSLATIGAFLWFGKNWWAREARDYRSNRLFKPVQTEAAVAMAPQPTLRLSYGLDLMRRNGPLVPDHGKLMHLFLVREPALDAFAHLHPTKIDWRTFETPLPALPPGEYRIYADITYETGFSDTLTTAVTLPSSIVKRERVDADDSWVIGPAQADKLPLPSAPLSTNHVMTRLTAEPLTANADTALRFAVHDKEGRPVPLEPYMGMRGHLILRHHDGSVFTHLHPEGSFSMAAKQLFEMRFDGRAPLKIAGYTNDPLCRLPLLTAGATGAAANELAFPYAFPRPGMYRVWVQTKISGEIMTGVFDVSVADSPPQKPRKQT